MSDVTSMNDAVNQLRKQQFFWFKHVATVSLLETNWVDFNPHTWLIHFNSLHYPIKTDVLRQFVAAN